MNILEIYRTRIIELNSRNNLPPELLHRNKLPFKLVSHINMAYSFFLSESYDYCALFIKRSEQEYYKDNKSHNYILDSMNLLKDIKKELIEKDMLSDQMKRIITE